MSIELLYVMIFLLGSLFVNEHFISKELKRALSQALYTKEVITAVGNAAISEGLKLATEIDVLKKQLEDQNSE